MPGRRGVGADTALVEEKGKASLVRSDWRVGAAPGAQKVGMETDETTTPTMTIYSRLTTDLWQAIAPRRHAAMHSAVCRTSPKPKLPMAASSCLSHLLRVRVRVRVRVSVSQP